MKKDLSKTYREINIMLDLLGDTFKQKLPKAMIPFFKEHEDKNYNPRITLTKEGFSKNIHTDTYVLISMMHINYWCEDPDEKERLRKLWMNPGKNGDYDVFSQDAYKNNLGINAATAKYKDAPEQSMQTSEEVTVDMNKYGNLFDNVGTNNTSNNLITNKNNNKAKNIFVKVTDSLKGLFATFSRK